jgi:hypothetical protein
MHEVFPVTMGALIGVGALRMPAGRWRWLTLAVISLVVGLVAALISGELAESWAFVLVDTAQVLVVALLAGAAVTVWHRRTTRLG